LFVIVVLGLVSSVQAKRLAGKNVPQMINSLCMDGYVKP